MTLSPAVSGDQASAPRTRLRRFTPVALIVVGVAMLVGLAAWLLVGPHLAATPTVGWQLAGDMGGPAYRPVASQGTTNVLLTTSWWPGCSPWGKLGQTTSDSSWLTSDITYTPTAVIITLHLSDLYLATKCEPFSFYDYWGLPVTIHLSEPLGGRALYDGSTSPPTAHPYP